MDSKKAAQRKAILAKLKSSGFLTSSSDPELFIPDKKEDEDSSEDPEYNFEKLKTFHIPRKREQHGEKELLTPLALQSREYIHTLQPAVKSSYFYSHSQRRIKINKAELVHNATLQKQFLERKRSMKDDGRSDKELNESYAFLYASCSQEAELLCQNGVYTGNTKLVSLGKHDMAVYLSRHADVITPNNFEPKQSGCIIVFKIVKGKSKLVVECRTPTTTQEPTPLFDCHSMKVSIEQAKSSHTRAYQMLQYYIYEYGDVDVAPRPRQILPYAVLHFTYIDGDTDLQRKDSVEEMGLTGSSPTGSGVNIKMFNLWKGRLMVKGGQFCGVRIATEIDTAVNVAFLDKIINIKQCISLEKFARLLPPSLLNKSGKKYNVIYRGRNYSLFNFLPSNDGGASKFRQLVAYLAQTSTAAVVTLKFSSCLYLVPMSWLTVEKMGLSPPSVEDEQMRKLFLYAVVVTPKTLSAKINEQRSNVINRKRKDTQGSKLPTELTMKLGQMNIDSSAIGSLNTEQIAKLTAVLKDKKRMQSSEKLIHSHYKSTDPIFPSPTASKQFLGKMTSLWATTHQLRAQQHVPKIKKKTVVRSALSTRVKHVGPPGGETDEEATFSADDDDADDVIADVIKPTEVRKRKISIEPPTPVQLKISRPSFQPLDVVLASDEVVELLQHPEFGLSTRYEMSHHVTSGASFQPAMKPDKLDRRREIFKRGHLSVTFRQTVPFQTSNDCPYVAGGEDVVKSMLRGMYGVWQEDPSEDKVAAAEKVEWVRDVLIRFKSSKGAKQERKIVEDVKMKSGSSPQDGADSSVGTVSTTTPSDAPTTLHNFANMLANVLQDRSQEGAREEPDSTGTEVVVTPHNILQALAKTVDEKGMDFPDLKEMFNDIKAPAASGRTEPVSSPPCAPDSTTKQSPVMTPQPRQPQDPRTRKIELPHPHYPPFFPYTPLPEGETPIHPPTKVPLLKTPNHPPIRTPHFMSPLLNIPPQMGPSYIEKLHPRGHPVSFTPELAPQDTDQGPPHPINHPYKSGGPLSNTCHPKDPRTYRRTPKGTVTNTPHLLNPQVTQDTTMNREVTQKEDRKFTASTSAGSSIGVKKGLGAGATNRVGEIARAVLRKLGIGATMMKGPLKDGVLDRNTHLTFALDPVAGTTGDSPLKSKLITNNTDRADPGAKNKPNFAIIFSNPGAPSNTPSVQDENNNNPRKPLGESSIHGRVLNLNGKLLKSITLDQNLVKSMRSLQSRRKEDKNDENKSEPPKIQENLNQGKLDTETGAAVPFSKNDQTQESEIKLSQEYIVKMREKRKLNKKKAGGQLDLKKAVVAPRRRNKPDTSGNKSSNLSNEQSGPPLKTLVPLNEPNNDQAGTLNSLNEQNTSKTKTLNESNIPNTSNSSNEPDTAQSKSSNDALTSSCDVLPLKVQKPLFEASETETATVSGNEVQNRDALIDEPAQSSSANHESSVNDEEQKDQDDTDPVIDQKESPPSREIENALEMEAEKISNPVSQPTVLSEIDEILSKVRSAPNESSELSGRLFQLALQLQQASGNSSKPASIASQDSGGKDEKLLEGKESESNDNSAAILKEKLPDNKMERSEEKMLHEKNEPKRKKFKKARESPTHRDVDSKSDDWGWVRETHTPTLDDTYDSNQDYEVSSSLRRSYANLNGLSTLAKPAILDACPVERICRRMTNTATRGVHVQDLKFEKLLPSGNLETMTSHFLDLFQDHLEAAGLQEDQVAESPHPANIAESQLSEKQRSQSPIVQKRAESPSTNPESLRKPLTEKNLFPSHLVKTRSVAHVKPQPGKSPQPDGPRFYVFNPRGHPDCDEMEDLLQSLKGVRYHPCDVTNMIARMTSSDERGIPITEELLERVLPAQNIWIVIRSADLELLPSLPYLALFKCAGPRVQFVCANSAQEVRTKDYRNVLLGEGGIILPVSLDVMLKNHAVFFQLYLWLVSTGENRKSGANVWRMALSDRILDQLRLIKEEQPPTSATQYKFAHAVLALAQDNPDSTLHLPSNSDVPTTAQIFDAAVQLQLDHAVNTRHVVVLVDPAAKFQQWAALRKAGVAVATVNQFIRTILDVNMTRESQGTTQQFSPLLKIYDIDRC